ncbi:MAG TPA: LLM class flavin-dependent oxidoreductase [Solirubrobacteraceae bacterium]|nr:LLM class flavin-dependent oxidoreductase [Solirubrobacteraceae bacterium]
MTDWGVLLPTFDPLRLGEPFPVAEAAVLAESLGFDSVWAGDHLKCPAPVLDATSCLAVAAAVTSRVELGFSVMLLGLRPLAWTAKQLATLQHLSGNRVRLGVGVGGEFPQEYAAAGVPLERRGERLDDALRGLPAFLGPGTEHSLEPPAPMPPILVGGRSDRAIDRAARFGEAWLPMWVSPTTLHRRAERLAELSERLGRPRPRLALLVLAHVDVDHARAHGQADAHLRGQYGMALHRVERWTALGSVAAVADFLEPYTQVGVSEILLLPLGGRPLEQIERLAEVASALRSRSDTTEIRAGAT